MSFNFMAAVTIGNDFGAPPQTPPKKKKNGVKTLYYVWLPGNSVVKNLPANAGDEGEADLIPGSRRSPGGGDGDLV